MLPKIITVHDCPPIPIRDFDWVAYREGVDEEGLYGRGRTEQEAIENLYDLEADALFDEPDYEPYGEDEDA